MKKSGTRIFTIAALLIIFIIGCKKEEATIPVLSSITISAITSTSATVIGNVTSDGGATITERGVCWSIMPSPTIGNSKATNGSTGTGSYTTNISGLTGNTTYYVRAYAKNKAGTGYSEEKSFVSSAVSDYATTLQATNIESSSTLLNGLVNANLMSTMVSFEYGITTSYGNSISASQSPVTGNSNTPVSASLIGLSPLTTYHFRVKITNSSGTSFGNDMVFITYYAIGETAYGGIIFYRDTTCLYGLVCATSDQGTEVEWGCPVTIGGTSTALYTGASNTNAIVAGCPTVGIAAEICNDLVLNTYSDWYLPSLDELKLMYLNLETQGLGDFIRDYYWSSSEYNASDAWFLSFYYGEQSEEAKYGKNYVRAVRSF